MASLLIPFDRKNDRLGDLEEEFGTKWLPEHGPRRATAIYVTQALYMVVRASLIPALIGWLIRAFQK